MVSCTFLGHTHPSVCIKVRPLSFFGLVFLFLCTQIFSWPFMWHVSQLITCYHTYFPFTFFFSSFFYPLLLHAVVLSPYVETWPQSPIQTISLCLFRFSFLALYMSRWTANFTCCLNVTSSLTFCFNLFSKTPSSNNPPLFSMRCGLPLWSIFYFVRNLSFRYFFFQDSDKLIGFNVLFFWLSLTE